MNVLPLLIALIVVQFGIGFYVVLMLSVSGWHVQEDNMGLFPKPRKPPLGSPDDTQSLWDTEAYKKWLSQSQSPSQEKWQAAMDKMNTMVWNPPPGEPLSPPPNLVNNPSFTFTSDLSKWQWPQGWTWEAGIPATGPMETPPTVHVSPPKMVKMSGEWMDVSKVGGPPVPSFLFQQTAPLSDDPYDWMVIVKNDGLLNQFISVGVKRKTKCGKSYGAWTKISPNWSMAEEKAAQIILDKLKKNAVEIHQWAEPVPITI